jgi:hypothetical protein
MWDSVKMGRESDQYSNLQENFWKITEETFKKKNFKSQLCISFLVPLMNIYLQNNVFEEFNFSMNPLEKFKDT